MFSIPLLPRLLLRRGARSNVPDDFVNRLSYALTADMFLFFAMLIGAKQQFGNPIECMIPKEWPSTWHKYFENFCFVHGTYYLPYGEPVPNAISRMTNTAPIKHIGYYQWVPLFFALQAFLFHVPNFFWASVQTLFDFDLRTVVDNAKELRTMKADEKRVDTMHRLIAFVRESLTRRSHSHTGFTIAFFYLLTKLLFLLNIILQFHFATIFIQANSYMWGIQNLGHLLSGDGDNWQMNAVFPRATICDVTHLKLASHQTITAQCVIPINMLNERIFIFVWFWLVVVGICTLVSLLHTFIGLSVPFIRYSNAKYYIQGCDLADDIQGQISRSDLEKFARHYLCIDGSLLIDFVDSYAGAIVARDLAVGLWTDFEYKMKHDQQDCKQKLACLAYRQQSVTLSTCKLDESATSIAFDSTTNSIHFR